VGLLWRRATAAAALWTIGLGFAFTAFLFFYVFRFEALRPYSTYQHPAFIAWIFCLFVMIVASLLTSPPPPEKVEGIIWSPRYARLPPELRERYGGLKDFRIWWLGFVLSILAIYGFFLWWRFQYPASAASVW
jgi:SSS family solute:Na+ symporter